MKRAEAVSPQPVYGYMRQKELMTLLPFSVATLWRKIKAGTFVQPVKLSTRITAFNRAEVCQWLSEQEGQK
jgi:predicted DNA-binding transcriptional regulator AlpA